MFLRELCQKLRKNSVEKTKIIVERPFCEDSLELWLVAILHYKYVNITRTRKMNNEAITFVEALWLIATLG